MSLFHGPAELEAARASCAERFPGRRLVEVVYHDPIDGSPLAGLLLAALTYSDAIAFYDARSSLSRWPLIADRLLFPAVTSLEALREEWPAFSLTVEASYRRAHGFSGDDALPLVRPLSPDTAPSGLSADDARALLAANAGARLWAVSLAENGLSLVWRQPTAETWSLAARVTAEAHGRRANTLCPALATLGDHCLWTPDGPLSAHLDALPGRAADLSIPWNQIGGLAARATARFL